VARRRYRLVAARPVSPPLSLLFSFLLFGRFMVESDRRARLDTNSR